MVVEQRILAGLVAFAAGDALGAPWEGTPPAALRDAALVPLPLRGDWPAGATSDDTAQLLLVAEALAGGTGGAAERFMAALAEEAPRIRGLGPTTRAAVERFRAGRPAPSGTRATNGAAMRAPAVGWALADPAVRLRVGEQVARTTHRAPRAVAAAHAVAALAGAALEGAPWPAALARAGAQAGVPGRWRPPAAGVTLDATETVAGVLHVLRRAPDVAAAGEAAVRLGGDTDTVAAVACGLMACRPDHAEDPIPWLDGVRLPARERLQRAAAALATRRA